ncbi:hypothetical protein JKP88DRAFT_156481, partial [Tribonema minus]
MDHVSIEDVDARSGDARRPVPDRLRDPRQRFCVLTVVAPRGTGQRCKDMLIRIHGCKETAEEASAWARSLRDSNDFYDVYVASTNEWVPLPPDVSTVEEVGFTDRRVQDIHDNFTAFLKGEKAE